MFLCAWVGVGLGELADIDGRFEPYRHTLFSVETLKLDRELQSRELNDKLNRSIGTFIRVLSNYILLKPAHQVLEYLIRRYKCVTFTPSWINCICGAQLDEVYTCCASHDSTCF